MAVEDLKEQLQSIGFKPWADTFAARIKLTPSGKVIEGGVEQQDARSIFPALERIAYVLRDWFEATSRAAVEDTRMISFGRVVRPAGADVSEAAITQTTRLYGHGIKLACLALELLTESAEELRPLAPAVPHPHIIARELDELALKESEVNDATRALCDGSTDQIAGARLTKGLSIEYAPMFYMSREIGRSAAEAFSLKYAPPLVTAGAGQTFVAVKNVIDAQMFAAQFNLS